VVTVAPAGGGYPSDPPPLTRDVVVETDLRIPMADGMELLADRWAPEMG
jgi:predicted acyl esterase